MSITHAKVSGVSDGSDSSLVQPSDWNAGHVIDIFVDNEVPTGTINSTDGMDGNNVFTLSATPSPASSLCLYQNGLLLRATVDFILSGATITFVAGYYPRTGDSLVASFRKA